jgi:hypothetical protein
MAWTNPTDPVSSTVITVAYAIANILTQIRWLRTLTGGADPPGSNYVVVSSSTTATAWTKVPDDALANAKVNKAGDTMSGNLSVTGTVTASGNVVSSGGGGVFPGGVTSASGAGTFAGNVSGNTLTSTIATGTAPITVTSTTVVTNLNADTVDGSHASAFALAAAGVPSGLIALVTNAAAIPSGWSRETALDGRIPVGDGTTDSVTFTAENNYGSSWSHVHSGPSHTHPASALGVSGNTGGPSALNGLGNGGGTSVPSTTHTHDQGSLDVTGTTDAAGTGATGSTSHQPMMRAYVYVKKS